MSGKIPSPIAYLISLVFIIAVWFLLAQSINASLILPGPGYTFRVLLQLLQTKAFWQGFAGTFVRVITAFTISVILGTGLGTLCGVSHFARNFFKLPLAIVRATPVVAFILVAYFWFKSGVIPVFVAVLMCLPIMVNAIMTGLLDVPAKLNNMAFVYNLNKWETFRYIRVPQSLSHFYTGALSCFGLSWKVVVAGEVISLPKRSMGTLLQQSQVHLETAEVMAQTIVIVFFSFIIETVFSILLKKEIKKHA